MSEREPDADSQVLNLRYTPVVPEGKCVYIQSGDPGDFDGYLIGVAGAELQRRTRDLIFALVVPERRACPNRGEADVNKHDSKFSESVLRTSGLLFRSLCPSACIVRGPLNKRNVIPLQFIFSEPEMYGPLVDGREYTDPISWRSVMDLARIVNRPDVTSVIIDMHGSVGYFQLLLSLCPSLGPKLKASGMPVVIMAGVYAEVEAPTLRLPGRDPRSTMNALYHADAVECLLSSTSKYNVPLLFVTNNVCNQMLKFEDAQDVADALDLQGLMKELAFAWYGPHLKGKCVPFDWVSFTAMLLHKRFPWLLQLEQRELWVGVKDPSILVLKHLDQAPDSPAVKANLEGTALWGVVDSVVSVDKRIMLQLARTVCGIQT